ncbi:hypothetical protein [Pseudactinotalea terrae]|uniref:hypothetical protein n=1 Tax=Pseudactinotalea terrae TaxID=1743262 RepID=UPI0012E17211|nr:hypothetical protein [Pseudactinotalea terrae]
MTDLAAHVSEHHRSLEDWLRTVLPDAVIGWDEAAADGAGERGVLVTLDEVRPVADRRIDPGVPLRLDLTYVLTPSGEPAAVATALVTIAAAVRGHESYQLADPPTESWWLAGLVPRRPAARLSSRLVIEPEPEPEAPPVRERRFQVTRPGRIAGTVTRAGLPLGGAEIGRLDSIERVRTDRHGRFVLTGVDSSQPVPVVVAAGRSRFTATIPSGSEDPQIVCPEPSD